jgi:ribulose-5-phosphate 4-epimerase/fuculose-1-phosphate aldolase
VIECVGQTKATGAFLRNHGLMTVGKNLRKAADTSYMVEHVVDILLKIKNVGITPTLIPEQTVKMLSQFAGAF